MFRSVRLLCFANRIGELAYCSRFKQDSKFEVHLIRLFYLGKKAYTNQGMSSQTEKVVIQSYPLHPEKVLPPVGESAFLAFTCRCGAGRSVDCPQRWSYVAIVEIFERLGDCDYGERSTGQKDARQSSCAVERRYSRKGEGFDRSVLRRREQRRDLARCSSVAFAGSAMRRIAKPSISAKTWSC